MADGMGSAWVPRRRKTDPSLRPQHAMEARMLIDIYTSRLASDRTYGCDGYYTALDDLRALVNLEPVDRSSHDEA